MPFWSDQQFMGYSIVGLHWMLTTFSPVPYLLALLPSSEMLHALAAFSALLLALTIGGDLLAARRLQHEPSSARVVGALLFGLGAFTLHKLSQLDISFSAITAMPVLLLLVRETRRETAARSFLSRSPSSGRCWSAYTILQEIAYIAMLFGSYALYRSVRLRSILAGPGRRAGVRLRGRDRGAARPDRRRRDPETCQDDGQLSDGAGRGAPLLRRWAAGAHAPGERGRARRRPEPPRGRPAHDLRAGGLGRRSMAGLVARSGWARAWGIGLLLVLSTALSLWWRPFYDSSGAGTHSRASYGWS